MDRPIKIRVGDILVLRKVHPCGSDKWEVTRTGIDIGLKCLGCGRRLLIPRVKLEKAIKKVLPNVADAENKKG
ncbi:MAG TPA: DUF951 domain-containing protein [Firmicutes bacterium]|nr:DUF951 domain-containing protein [Bacillota bacterium]